MTADELDLPAGTGVLHVRARGGRVDALRTGRDAPNLLWDGDADGIAGGDRMWPAPEVDLFYDDEGDWGVPVQVDPGSWTLRRDGDAALLEQHAIGARFVRHVVALQDPPVATELAWSGYVVSDALETDRPWSAWHLVMLPAPARVGVRAGAGPVDYYPPVPSHDDGWYATTGVGERWKAGWAAPADGRVAVACLRRDALVVVLADAPADGTYVDVPPGGGPGTAVQVYDDHGRGFCEVEHHAPLETRAQTSTVCGFTGPPDALREVVDALS